MNARLLYKSVVPQPSCRAWMVARSASTSRRCARFSLNAEGKRVGEPLKSQLCLTNEEMRKAFLAEVKAAIERDDADIAERDRLIAHLDAVAKRNRTELTERDRLAWLHQRWDQARMAENPDADPPPPLFPSDRPA